MAIPLTRHALVLALLLIAPAVAGALERGPLDAAVAPWSALGRVNAGGRAYCSGVLIGRSTALTAAHCVYDFRNRRWWPPSDISFVAGYLRDAWVATAKAKRVIRDANVKLVDRHPQLGAVPADWALIELESPIGDRAGWLPLSHAAPPASGVLALQAGYRRDRPHAPELSPPCRVLEAPPGLVFHDCVVPEGGSGSPLLAVEADGGIVVAGVHSAQVHRTTTDGTVNVFSAVIPAETFAWRVPRAKPPAVPEGSVRRALLSLDGDPQRLARASLDAVIRELYLSRDRDSEKSGAETK